MTYDIKPDYYHVHEPTIQVILKNLANAIYAMNTGRKGIQHFANSIDAESVEWPRLEKNSPLFVSYLDCRRGVHDHLAQVEGHVGALLDYCVEIGEFFIRQGLPESGKLMAIPRSLIMRVEATALLIDVVFAQMCIARDMLLLCDRAAHAALHNSTEPVLNAQLQLMTEIIPSISRLTFRNLGLVEAAQMLDRVIASSSRFDSAKEATDKLIGSEQAHLIAGGLQLVEECGRECFTVLDALFSSGHSSLSTELNPQGVDNNPGSV